MLLADIKLIEVNTRSVSFDHIVTEPGEGQIRVEYGELEFEVGGVLVGDESNSTIRIKASPAIYGFREGKAGEDFVLKIVMNMLYVYPGNQNIDEDYLRDNHWYFASMVKTHFKFYAEDILGKSSINGVQLPFN